MVKLNGFPGSRLPPFLQKKIFFFFIKNLLLLITSHMM